MKDIISVNSLQPPSCPLDVSFRHSDHDLVEMRIAARGTVWKETTHREISCWVSSVFCPFASLVSWLEAVTTGVESCGFTWDAEGPTGKLELRWDLFTLTWDCRGTQVLHATVDRRQVVKAFYFAFRRFVESSEYDPLWYERVRIGEAYVLRGSRTFTEEELTEQLLTLDWAAADTRLESIWPTSVPLGSCDGVRPWAPREWDQWPLDRRGSYLREWFDELGDGADGGPIRAMRSQVVERWLEDDGGHRVTRLPP